ncbi:MAG: hypothetical protein J3R72DRAFT_508360, partial [Linnemannia gamsii]
MAPPILSTQWLRQATGKDIMTLFDNLPPSSRNHSNYKYVREINRLLHQMIKWLDNNSREYDRQFAANVKDRLLTTVGLTNKSFEITAFKYEFYIGSALTLSEEEWLDDSVIAVLLRNLQSRHSNGGRNRFIQDFLRQAIESMEWPTQEMVGSFQWDWMKNDISSNAVDRAFGIYNSKGHWFVVCIDFQQRQVFEGDSLNWGMPDHVRQAIIQWLVSALPDSGDSFVPMNRLEGWTFHKLDMPRQGGDSGSCGIVAANAIECILDPKAAPWTRQKRVSFRLRLLRMMMNNTPFTSERDYYRGMNGGPSFPRASMDVVSGDEPLLPTAKILPAMTDAIVALLSDSTSAPVSSSLSSSIHTALSNVLGDTASTSASATDDAEWDDWVPYKGCTFVSKAEATTRISDWALRKGFKITRGSKKQRSYGYY